MDEGTGSVPSILHLHGVDLEEAKQDFDLTNVLERRLLEEAGLDEEFGMGSYEGSMNAELSCDKIPRVFTSVEKWPMSTNLRCWNCDLMCKNYPKFIPTAIKTNADGSITAGVRGNFGSWECAAKFIEDTYSFEEGRRAHERLCHVYRLFTGVFTVKIEPALSKLEMRIYGGSLLQQQYEEKLQEIIKRNLEGTEFAMLPANYEPPEEISRMLQVKDIVNLCE